MQILDGLDRVRHKQAKTRARNALSESEAHLHKLLVRVGFRRAPRGRMGRAGGPLCVHRESFSVVLFDRPLTDRTTPQPSQVEDVGGEEVAPGFPSDSGAHVMWSEGS